MDVTVSSKIKSWINRNKYEETSKQASGIISILKQSSQELIIKVHSFRPISACKYFLKLFARDMCST